MEYGIPGPYAYGIRPKARIPEYGIPRICQLCNSGRRRPAHDLVFELVTARGVEGVSSSDTSGGEDEAKEEEWPGVGLARLSVTPQ